MEKQLCIIHANCQGPPLMERLLLCPEFAERYECRLFTNYTREPVPEAMLGECGLLLYQRLGEEWGDLASDALCRRLSDSALSLCVPNMFFHAYWPLWYDAPGFDYRDRLLDALLEKGLPGEQVLMLALRSDPANMFDLDAIVEASIERERMRESFTPVKYLDYILTHWRERKLFHSVNHPGQEMLAIAARGVLQALGMEPPESAVLMQASHPYPEFELPIHPAMAKRYGLAFAGADAVYEIYGVKMSYARYAAAYIECRLAGIEDFIGYLQATAENLISSEG